MSCYTSVILHMFVKLQKHLETNFPQIKDQNIVPRLRKSPTAIVMMYSLDFSIHLPHHLDQKDCRMFHPYNMEITKLDLWAPAILISREMTLYHRER